MSSYAKEQRASLNADQLELAALRDGVASASQAAIDEIVSGEIEDEARRAVDTTIPRYERESAAVSDLSAEALHVIQQRSRLLGDDYPFDLERSSLKPREGGSLLYTYCLAVSAKIADGTLRFRQLVRHYERLSMEVVAFQLGTDRFVRVGWPTERAYANDAAGSFERRIKTAKRVCRYDKNDFRVTSDTRMKRSLKNLKDGRIDAIVHKHMPDGRPGGVTALIQCGCGKHDVDEQKQKSDQLNLNWLNLVFDTLPHPLPLRIFATSQHIVHDDHLHAMQAQGDCIAIDRIRLVLFDRDFDVCRSSCLEGLDKAALDRRLAKVTEHIDRVLHPDA